MIRHVTLIEPKNNHLHIFSRFELPRLGGVLLATILRDQGYEADALFASPEDALRAPLSADLVGISTITATAPGAYRIADELRRRGTPVVLGGPHASFLPAEALEHADFCVTGEGETALPRLVEALNGKASLESVPGLAWKDHGEIRTNPRAAPVEDLDSLPFADFSLLRVNSGKPFLRPGHGHPTIPIQTSRGCPFDCTFCSVTGMFGRRYRHRSAANVLSELSRYDPRRCLLFFYDDNFTANPRRSKELLREMIRLRLGFKWSTQVRTDVAKDPEMLDLMAEAGCIYLYIGFESVDPVALREMHKSQTVEDMRSAIREIHRRRIGIHGMFVFGFDSDTPQTARATVDFALQERVDTAQFLILTPLPGSDFYGKVLQEGRLIDRAWDTYDAHHVKYLPRGFSPWELQLAQIRAHARFYAPLRVAGRLVRGNLTSVVIGLYARGLNRRWQIQERDYLNWLRMLRPAPMLG
ncbi:MAG TPA: radical SAM protein [Spirochaetia bacterium]|nr:radical SAM protein [Spirochaetia bacterium]